MGELFNTLEDDAENSKLHLIAKLQYLMSDRAASMKKSNEVLNEWRHSMLEDLGEQNTEDVHSIFCMAHVLLGFHSYTVKALNNSVLCDDDNVNKNGRNRVCVLLKNASNLFGPVGDHCGYLMCGLHIIESMASNHSLVTTEKIASMGSLK